MRSLLPIILAAISLLTFTPSEAADNSDVKSETLAVVGKIQAKLQAGKRTEQDLADDIKGFDAILEKRSAEKSDEVANVLLTKAMLYAQVLNDDAKGRELLAQVEKDFPGTKSATTAAQIQSSLDRKAAAKKIRDTLAVGSPFPAFQEQSVDGKSLSLSELKGKVVLVDFWATWSPPSVEELPHIRAAYEKYHDAGFEVVGISLDKDQAALTKFLAGEKIPWPQYFDGLGWKNKLALKYGVNSIPAAYLLDKDGNILAKGLRGENLENAVAKTLGVEPPPAN